MDTLKLMGIEHICRLFFYFEEMLAEYNKILKNQTTFEKKTNCIHEHMLAGLKKLKNEEKS